jgi:RNase adaptor protein for sRNA GlmZ degradation
MGRDITLNSVWIMRGTGWAVWVILAAFCTGCVALAVGAAGGAAGAVYVMGKLTEEVSGDVPAVHGAALTAIKDLELKLSEDRADKLSAHMESEFADRAHVWIDLKSIGETRTRVTIRVGLTGDEVRSRKILDTIKQYLPQAGGGSREVPERGDAERLK